MRQAQPASGSKSIRDLGLELGRQHPLEQARAEALVLRRRDRRPAALEPVEVEHAARRPPARPPSATSTRPPRRDSAPYFAALVVSSWIAMPIGTRKVGGQLDAGPSQRDAAAALVVGSELVGQELAQGGLLPVVLGQEGVGVGERHDAADEAAVELVDAGRPSAPSSRRSPAPSRACSSRGDGARE